MKKNNHEELKKIYFKNKIFPSLLTKYPSQYIFTKIQYSKDILKYGDTKDKNSLYIHIPFCSSICKFCNLYAVKYTNKEDVSEYIKYIYKEIDDIAIKMQGKISYIWIGGGTPNLFSPNETDELFQYIFKKFQIINDYHLELDVHPLFMTDKLLKVYEKHKVSLLSLGVQSFSKDILDYSGRNYLSQKMLMNKISLINMSKINVHLDFIVGLPNDNLDFDYELLDDFLKDLEIFSISVNKYENTFNTEFFKTGYRTDPSQLTDKHRVVRELESYLLNKHNIRRNQSIFIKSFFRNRYNVIAIGSGAYGYLRGEGVYRNSLLANYGRNAYDKKFFPMSIRDEKIMYLLHNWDSPELSFLYKEQFGTYMANDFKSFFGALSDDFYSFIDEKHIKFCFSGNDIAEFFLGGLMNEEVRKYYK